MVTGGGTGIGLMITQALAYDGAKVYIIGRREEALNSVVEQYLPGDISSKDDVKRLAAEVAKKEIKGIHLLVNDAGIARIDNTRLFKAGKPNFSSAQASSEHLLQSEPETMGGDLPDEHYSAFLYDRSLPAIVGQGEGFYTRVHEFGGQRGFHILGREGDEYGTVRLRYVKSGIYSPHQNDGHHLR